MREIEFSCIYQHDETGRIINKRYNIEDIENFEFNADIRGYSLIARRQYAGLKDKNGVKIFEGDVVRFIDSEGRDSIIEVRFENGGFDPFAPDYLHCSYVEVIGNIYENSELLEQN